MGQARRAQRDSCFLSRLAATYQIISFGLRTVFTFLAFN
jgi:hypothetical protein